MHPTVGVPHQWEISPPIAAARTQFQDIRHSVETLPFFTSQSSQDCHTVELTKDGPRMDGKSQVKTQTLHFIFLNKKREMINSQMTKQTKLSKTDLSSIKVSCNADGHIQSRLFKVSLQGFYFLANWSLQMCCGKS